MKISIASDHAGFELKGFLIQELRSKGFDVYDHGAHELVPEDDYPLYIAKVADDISKYEEAKRNGDFDTHDVHGNIKDPAREHVGIIIGGSGQGEAIAANKFPFVRAAVVYGGVSVGGSLSLIEKITKLSREHNDANIISLGARFLSNEEALTVVKLWLETEFSSDEKYARRINETVDIENDISV